MSLFNCNFKCSCTFLAAAAAILIGITATLLQITAVITVTPAFLWVLFGIAVVYLGILGTAALTGGGTTACCTCPAINTLLTGILGTVLFSVLLLGIGIVATSVLSAIFVGLLLFFFTLVITGSACLVRYLVNCGD